MHCFLLDNMKKQIITIILFLSLSSCFSIRTPFIPINYYYLNQETFSFRNIAEIETYIVFREFNVPEELYDNKLMIWYDDGTVQKFNYHRFHSDYPELINNFIYNRFNLSKAFKYGLTTFNSSIVPNFILEGNVLEFKTFAHKKDKKKNWVQVTIQSTLVKYKPLAPVKEVVFSHTYSQKMEVPERENSSFVQGFSKALSLVVDKMILDIQSAIAHLDEK